MCGVMALFPPPNSAELAQLKVKVKLTPEQATKDKRWSRGTALLFL
jgi:hypothetical protein